MLPYIGLFQKLDTPPKEDMQIPPPQIAVSFHWEFPKKLTTFLVARVKKTQEF